MRRCCVDDGGFWTSVVALQGEITNHPQAAAVKSCGGERCGRRRALSASGVTQEGERE
jgi:hypothetical protein